VRLGTRETRARVATARATAADRLSSTPWSLNAHVTGAWLRSPQMRLSSTVTAPIDRALERGGITMRGYDRVLRVAWTLADIDGVPVPVADHIGRALYLRKAMAS
jgi:magnesium chelatase family protein